MRTQRGFSTYLYLTYVIKQASGHKTDSAFQRYILVTEDEMVGKKWLDQKRGKSGTMDTYMDTIEQLKKVQFPK